jgi:hypothetical protein
MPSWSTSLSLYERGSKKDVMVIPVENVALMVLQPNDTASRMLVALTSFPRTGREFGVPSLAKTRFSASESDNATVQERKVLLESRCCRSF